MIAISDNTAANEIASAIRPQSVNDTMARLGLGGTHFLNLFNDGRSTQNPGENQTTPSNMAKLLQMVATDQMVNPQVSGDIRGLLSSVQADDERRSLALNFDTARPAVDINVVDH